MPSIASEQLRARAQPAIDALFTAYEFEKNSQDAWIAGVLQESPEIAEDGHDRILRDAFRDQLFTVAGCIVVVGDSIVKACAIENLEAPDRSRQYFGTLVAGEKHFGAALQAGANAFRHSAEWEVGQAPHRSTETILKSLGVPLDESTCYRILELSRVTNADSFINAIDATCLEMEQGAACARCGHPASDHRRDGDTHGRGCRYRPGIADGLLGSIAEVTAAVLVRAQTAGYRCSCKSSRKCVVERWLTTC